MWLVAMGGKGLPPAPSSSGRSYRSKGAGAGNGKPMAGTGPGVLSVRLTACRKSRKGGDRKGTLGADEYAEFQKEL